MNGLKKRRSVLKGQMTRLTDFVNNKINEATLEELELRAERCEMYMGDFVKIEDAIFAIDDKEESGVPEFEEYYYHAHSKIKAKIRDIQMQNQQPNLVANDTLNNTLASTSAIEKLPRLKIPTFDGSYADWQSFYDLYTQAVHNNSSVSAAQKFQILKGVLQGDALRTIKHFSVTDANYIQAFQMLKETFDMPIMIIQSYISTFVDQQHIKEANESNFERLVQTYEEVTRGLKALGSYAESRDHWIINIGLSKLDVESQKLWSSIVVEKSEPTLTDFYTFLKKRRDSLKAFSCTIKSRSRNQRPSERVSSMHAESQDSCEACEGPSHHLSSCNAFKEMSVEDRRKLVGKMQRCFNCLSKGHRVYRCKSRSACHDCERRHHHLLHLAEPQTPDPIKPQQQSTSQEDGESSVSLNISENGHISHKCTAVLPTALVNIKDSLGSQQLCRALLDSGSQRSFISESCAQRLRLRRRNARIVVTGLGSNAAATTRGIVDLEISSRLQSTQKINLQALVISKVTSKLPSRRVDVTNWSQINELPLADPEFNVPGEIDVLIGIDQFFNVLKSEQLKFEDLAIAHNSIFGWILAGSVQQEALTRSVINLHIGDDVDKLLKQFWEIEEVSSIDAQTSAEEFCEEHFKQNYSRAADGRFIVRLPFTTDAINLDASKDRAVKRMTSVERRFQKDPNFHSQYLEFMRDYERLGHMEKIPEHEADGNNRHRFYLPHHGIIQNSGMKKKLRVVFDASAKSLHGTSLNDRLSVGPTIQQGLIPVLLRFRFHRFVFTCDIEKMYRQILIHKNDTDYQRIVWREDQSTPMMTYRLLTVTYGTSCAPFLAVRVLQQVAEDNEDIYPEAAEVIRRDFYVDDLMTGAADIEEATKLQEAVIQCLKTAGLSLRKWSSNSSRVLENITEEDRELKTISLLDDHSVKVLGIQWDPSADQFKFQCSMDETPILTKRGFLSEASRLFDPLGWLAPCTIIIKTMFQKLWLHDLNWDDGLPTDFVNSWCNLRNEMLNVDQIEIPRWLPTSTSRIELHGFSDASEMAYAAVIYARTYHNGAWITNLLMSKTKVAPIQQLSIPRLELCGANLLIKLMLYVQKYLTTNDVTITYWTDSTIVLHWISSLPRRWKTYVANRVSNILQHSKGNQWHHVKSSDNPADLASRGVVPSSLSRSRLWWHGPVWMQYDESQWPAEAVIKIKDDVERAEERKLVVHVFQTTTEDSVVALLVNAVSSYPKIIRVWAYVRRFIMICQKRFKRDVSMLLTVEEIVKAEKDLIRQYQCMDFAEEIQCLKNKKIVRSASKIKSLSPYLDDDLIICVGGRIQNAEVSMATKHPIILSGKSKLAERIATNEHLRNLHAGQTLLVCTLRQRFWIIGCKDLARRTVRSCMRCFRFSQNLCHQRMGNLPSARVTYSRPFLRVGVDYAGPILVKPAKGRHKAHKGYISIFVCLSTKAVHIELVNDASTDSFLAAVHRFCARRGVCSAFYSDNGSNFIGANNKMKEWFLMLNKNTNHIYSSLLREQIQWFFNPPAAPHFGGLWEAAVKSTKFHLRRVLGESILTYEEMSTLLAQIEAILNSRPICGTSSSDEEFLTPAHFLIGQPLTMIPQPSLVDVKMSHLTRWQMTQKLIQHFWSRWHIEYLTSLQSCNKWLKEEKNLMIGDLVLVKDENSPPAKWHIGRIEKTYPGKDGLVRVVSVKIAGGSFERPIHKLSKLPIAVEAEGSRRAECSEP